MTNRVCRIGLLALLALAAVVHAGQERYDYDALGRLIRFINPAGQATEYVYDAVGNILEVRRGAVQSPQITGVAPDTVRHRTTTAVVVSGTHLLGATVTTTQPGLHITGVNSTDTTVNFNLLADDTVPLGAHPFTLSFSTGTAAFNLTVRPVLPQIIVAPSPVVMAPGGAAPVQVSLSNADLDAHRLALTVTDSTVAVISTATLDFPAGQTQASLTVTSGAVGISAIDLNSATLAPARVGIYVNGDEGPGDRLRLADSVGIVRIPTPVAQPSGPFVAARVGVIQIPTPVAQPSGPFVAARVGVIRQHQANAQSIGPFVAPAVGVLKAN